VIYEHPDHPPAPEGAEASGEGSVVGSKLIGAAGCERRGFIGVHWQRRARVAVPLELSAARAVDVQDMVPPRRTDPVA